MKCTVYKSAFGNLRHGVMRLWYVKGYSDHPDECNWFETKKEAKIWAEEQELHARQLAYYRKQAKAA